MRNRAAVEGQFVMSLEAYTVMLIQQCRLSAHQVHNLLLRYKGRFPSNEDEFQEFVQGVRRVGLLHDDTPNTVGSMIGRNRPVFLTNEGQDAEEPEVEQSSGIYAAWSWDRSGSQEEASGSQAWTFPSAQEDASESTSATSSDDGERDDTIWDPEIEGMNDQDAAEHIYYQYRSAKRNWRRYTGRPVRRFRRTFKKSHIGRGKGKGSSFGRRTNYRKTNTRGKGFWFTEPVMTFLQSKGKGSRTTGKGFGRKGNPRDKNGEVMKCRICASTEHLMARCPKKGEGKGSSSSSGATPGFAGYSAADTEALHPTYLARNRNAAETEVSGRSPEAPVTGTGTGESYMGAARSAPRPPWEEDESHERQIQCDYIVLAGDPDQEGEAKCFMNCPQDPFVTQDPWKQQSFAQRAVQTVGSAVGLSLIHI